MGIPLTLSSVPSVTPYIQYIAAGGQMVYPYPFPITQDSDLVVVINGVTQATNSGYALSGQGNPTGGNVTLNSGSTGGDIITLFRDIVIQRITQIGQNSGFNSTAFNAEFNNIYLILQQLQESIDLSLQIPNTNNPAAVTSLGSNYANKYLAFDTHGNPTAAALTSSGTVTEGLIVSLLTQADIAGLLIPRTANEITAAVVPVNFQYPELCVDRYATNTTPGTTDMTTAWQNAIAVAAVKGGTVTCLQAGYLISGTLTIAAGVTIDGGNSLNTYVLGSCAQIISNTNVPTLTYNNGSRFTGLRNISLVGNVTKLLQDALQIGQVNSVPAHGIRIQNVGMWNFGRYGMLMQNSIAGDYRSIYISGCGNGIAINATGSSSVGANRWYNVNITNSVSADIDIVATNGGVDSWYGLTVETSPYGLVFETGVVGQKFYGVHSEGHATQSCWFKSGSNKNFVDFETVGSSEPLPLNNGGAQNAWSGNWVVAGVLKDPIASKCVQRVFTPASVVVSGSGLSAYSATVAPTTGGGLQILSRAITAKNTGTSLAARTWGVSRIGTTGTMIVALFQSGSTTAIAAIQMPAVGGTWYSWSISDHELVAGTQNNATTFTVRVGSTTGPDTADAFGQFGGAIASGGISVEEYLPSTG